MSLCEEIHFLTERALWETRNLMECVPGELWEKRYDEIPMWKYIFHMLYSMDRWYINPKDEHYQNPDFYQEGLADLNVVPGDEKLTRQQLLRYLDSIERKICSYLKVLKDEELLEMPKNCEMTRFRLILGQFRHWHRHMGLIYGFLVEDTGKWPYVLNMCGAYPTKPMPNFYDD